jgi:predicted nucleotidyltransferase
MVKTGTRGLGIAEIIGDKRDEILRLAHKHGATNVRVFGSVARGEAGPESDLDLLVDWVYSRLSAWGGVGFELEVEELLGREVDVASESSLHWYIRDRVLQEAVAL